MSTAKKSRKTPPKKQQPAKTQRQSAPARSASPAALPRDTGPMKAQTLMTQPVAAGMQFDGTLHRVDSGALTESFLRAAGLADRLLLRNANTLGAQIQAATNFFAANAEGDAISVNGVQITLGTGSGILF